MPCGSWKHLDAFQVAAEGGQAGEEALIVPDVCQHHGEGREPGRRCSRHRHPCLGHQHGQPKRLQDTAHCLRMQLKGAECRHLQLAFSASARKGLIWSSLGAPRLGCALEGPR